MGWGSESGLTFRRGPAESVAGIHTGSAETGGETFRRKRLDKKMPRALVSYLRSQLDK